MVFLAIYLIISFVVTMGWVYLLECWPRREYKTIAASLVLWPLVLPYLILAFALMASLGNHPERTQKIRDREKRKEEKLARLKTS